MARQEVEMSEKRTPLSKFVKSAWTNMNIRAGKYRHLGSASKHKCYVGIYIEFSREEFKTWCAQHLELILKLKRPSVDRIDSTKNYSLENLQIVELSENLKRKTPGSSYLNGPKSNTRRGVRKVGGKFQARITYRQKQQHLGMFDTFEEAATMFRTAYVRLHGREPW